MAYDSYEDDYHLTPRGWDSSNERPADSVETWRISVYQASGWSKEHRSWSRVWVDPDTHPTTIAELHERFPPPVRTTSLDDERRRRYSPWKN
jgi:hypothetical protein